MTRPLSKYHQARLDARFRKAWREADWQANDRRCRYCLSTLTRAEVTADHKRARCNGGPDKRENVVAACYVCNQLKGSLSVSAFTRMLKGVVPAPFEIRIQAAVRRINLRADRACKRIRALCPARKAA